MHLINSKIVPPEQNVFWDDLPEAWTQLPPRSLLVISEPYQPRSAEEQTLIKMLAACKLQPEEYHILQLMPGQQVAWHKCCAALEPGIVLMLGISPARLGISALLRPFEPNIFNERTIIVAPALSALETNPEAKKELWVKGLQPAFAQPAR